MDMLEVVESVSDWKRLGLNLGLSYPTLADIEIYRRGKPDYCKIEMLSAWLQQQDKVSQWDVLRAALRSMGEHEIADKISKRTAVITQPSIAAAGVSGDITKTLSEFI